MTIIKQAIEFVIFKYRSSIILVFLLLTAFMFYLATGLRMDTGFNKFLPLKHEYIQTYIKHEKNFGNANHILIALKQKQGDIFTKDFFSALKAITDEVFFIPGVERSRVKSLFTPNARYTEVVEEGIVGGNIIPDKFTADDANFARIRKNIQKSNYLGQLVSHDFTSALISAELQDMNPQTGERIDYIKIATALEHKVRQHYSTEQSSFTVHIIGFTKIIGDLAEGIQHVIPFFMVAFFVISLLIYFYTRSIPYTLIILFCAMVAVIWQLGLLALFDYRIDPILILIPFLIFAIAVSHGMQMVSAHRAELSLGAYVETAARNSFQRLFIPGSIALLSDTIGFISILFINIQVIQEMAISASLGVAVIILSNMIVMPLLFTLINITEKNRQALKIRAKRRSVFWQCISRVTEQKPAMLIIASSLFILFSAWPLANNVKIGDVHSGVPEFKKNSIYNLDAAMITKHFSLGVDVFTIIIETEKEACVDYDIMQAIDDFSWYIQNIEGVQSVISLPTIAKKMNVNWNEGHPKWHVLPRNLSALAQSVASVETSTGLLNSDCSVMPVIVFTEDHKAETIERLINAVKDYRHRNSLKRLEFKLATGNLGIMAARNEAVRTAQFSILFYVFTAIILLCLISFRSIAACVCIVGPLAWVSVMTYAIMNIFEIGLKISTLPIIALGIGIGVDYGIYIFSQFQTLLKQGKTIQSAYSETLMISGNAVLFTGLSLAAAVMTWIFSPLKFQADMGILLTFMFLVNMLTALFMIPALARWFITYKHSSNKMTPVTELNG